MSASVPELAGAIALLNLALFALWVLAIWKPQIVLPAAWKPTRWKAGAIYFMVWMIGVATTSAVAYVAEDPELTKRLEAARRLDNGRVRIAGPRPSTAGKYTGLTLREYPPAVEKTIPAVYASNLYRLYQANELAAKQRFEGKTIRTYCFVSEIRESATGNPYLQCGGIAGLGAVELDFPRTWESEMAKLRKGVGIVAVCTVSGMAIEIVSADCSQYRVADTRITFQNGARYRTTDWGDGNGIIVLDGEDGSRVLAKWGSAGN